MPSAIERTMLSLESLWYEPEAELNRFILMENVGRKKWRHLVDVILLVLGHSIVDGNPTHLWQRRHLVAFFGLRVRRGEFRPQMATH